MTSVEKIMMKHAIGQPIFCELFKHDARAIKQIVERIIKANGSQYLEQISNLFSDSPGIYVYKIMRNDEPEEIRIASWSSIEISWLGVQIKPERGATILVCEFGETFKLPVI